MKKTRAILALLLSLCICLGLSACDAPVSKEQESGDPAGYGYIDRFKEFYIVVPANWTLIGIGSTQENLANARKVLAGNSLGLDADEIYRDICGSNTDFDALYERQQSGETLDLDHTFVAISVQKGENDAQERLSGLVLTLGKNEYVSNASLIDRADEIKDGIKKSDPTIRFMEEDCGSYSFKSLESILRLHMVQGQNDIDQYFLITGENMYIFTFMNASEDEKTAVFTFFKTGVTEFEKQEDAAPEDEEDEPEESDETEQQE